VPTQSPPRPQHSSTRPPGLLAQSDVSTGASHVMHALYTQMQQSQLSSAQQCIVPSSVCGTQHVRPWQPFRTRQPADSDVTRMHMQVQESREPCQAPRLSLPIIAEAEGAGDGNDSPDASSSAAAPEASTAGADSCIAIPEFTFSNFPPLSVAEIAASHDLCWGSTDQSDGEIKLPSGGAVANSLEASNGEGNTVAAQMPVSTLPQSSSDHIGSNQPVGAESETETALEAEHARIRDSKGACLTYSLLKESLYETRTSDVTSVEEEQDMGPPLQGMHDQHAVDVDEEFSFDDSSAPDDSGEEEIMSDLSRIQEDSGEDCSSAEVWHLLILSHLVHCTFRRYNSFP
jgi:hypothetical protein